MTPILIVRRARRDAGILIVWIALVAFAFALAVGQPRLLRQTVDAGARQAVATAGSRTDVNITGDVGVNMDTAVAPVDPGDIEGLGTAIPHRLPGALRSVVSGSTLTVLGPSTQLVEVNGAASVARHPVAVQVAQLTRANEAQLRIRQGALPGSAGGTPVAGADLDVILSAASASAAGLEIGSVFQVSTIPVSSAVVARDALTMRVVGIAARSGATEWASTPNLWRPVVPAGSSASTPIRITVLADAAGVTAASRKYSDPFTATVNIRLAAQKFTAAKESAVAAELVALAGHTDRLAGDTSANLGESSEFGVALAGFPAREYAAVAQVSIVAAGVLGVAAAVLLLVSRMLVQRREAELALERARGASLPGVASRALLESVVLGLVGGAIGLGILALAVPGPFLQVEFLGFVVAVALLATPVQAVLLVRGTWTGRKIPANRIDRVELASRARVRRIAVEVTLIALAAGALVSLSTRGLLQTQTGGVDLLLASAPLLLAAAIAVIILRVYRWPVQVGIAAGRRSTGAIGLLAAVRAQRSIAALPLLALTLAVGLAVSGGLLESTVSAGQETASWQRIGADVRVHSAATAGQLAAIGRAKGVSAVTSLSVEDGVQLRLTGGTDFATLIGVDGRYAHFVRSLPASGAGAAGAAALARLASASAGGDTIPVVVNPELAREISTTNVGMFIGVKFVPMRVVGVTDESPAGYLAAPFVFVDRAALARQLGHPVPVTMVLVNGPGARAAVGLLGARSTSALTRAGWLSARRALALVHGVSRAITLATIGSALLAILALMVTLLAGARERGRSFALVRTLGLPARAGWWLALAELGPVLVAALVGGIVAGAGIVLLLEPAMGLGELAGGLGDPAPVVSLGLIVGLVAAAVGLLLVAVLVEIVVRSRDRLSEVLRVGEST